MATRLILFSLFLAACGTVPPPATAPVPGAGLSVVPDTDFLPVPVASAASIARAKADSLRYAYTPADIRFMTMMIDHHAQAVRISRWAASHGASAEVQRLALRIIAAQRDEIVIMQQWLADRRQPVPDPSRATAGHAGHGDHGGHELMPGMLTDAELAELDAARGSEFDVQFLRKMIRHHEGAVRMVDELFATDRAAQDELVFKFANDVQVDQRTEVARMERMLAARLFGVSAP